MRLVEPLGLIDGEAAFEAVEKGLALPLSGGPLAFALVRLIGGSSQPSPLLPIGRVPEAWMGAVRRVSAVVPPWAGLDPGRPAIMGILNVTPDSFSDGGAYRDPAAAVRAGVAMAAAGADIIDVGGESTQPGAAATPPGLEQARVLPIISALAARGLRVSVDTRNAATMAAALDAGATIVNDVSALSRDTDAAPLLARRGCPVVLMHMRGEPATMNAHAHYEDAATAVTRELARRVAAAERGGITPDRIAVDPGIGFAKTAAHNLALISRLAVLSNLGRRILVGISRKSFVGRLAGDVEPGERDPGSLALGLHCLARGASILRVHDVAGTAQAVRVRHAAFG